jgi:hypothetical protein
MACKIAVLRQDTGRKNRGDCVKAYNINDYLGSAVEPKGGSYVVVEVSDCDKDHETIKKLVAPWVIINSDFNANDESSSPYAEHSTFDRKFHLRPVNEGDQFFYDLFNNGRIRVTLAKLEEYVMERSDA